MELLDYTDKSFVVLGEETRNHVNGLKQFGGRYNPNLTHPETKNKMAGWIFSKKQKEKVQAFVNNPGPIDSSMTKSFDQRPTAKRDIIEDIVDPIQRLGLKDNGPDPPKKTRKSTTPKKHVSSGVKITISDGSTTPEIVEVASFSMIVPKIGMGVKLVNEAKEELVLEIVETKKNNDGYVFEFQARHDEIIVDFVMVGKEWRRISTEVPHLMNFI